MGRGYPRGHRYGVNSLHIMAPINVTRPEVWQAGRRLTMESTRPILRTEPCRKDKTGMEFVGYRPRKEAMQLRR
jgi:hypothetical protein